MRKPSYRVTKKGIEIDDQRQLTNGTIIPNYAIDLCLPIIGYEGLGVWATLLRQATLYRNDEGVGEGLKKLARAGRMGYTPFCNMLALLEELGIIKVYRPEGRGRMEHERTRIELHDPPTSVPAKYVAIVTERTLNHNFIDLTVLTPTPNVIDPSNNGQESVPTEFSFGTSTSSHLEPHEFPNGNSMEVSHENSTPIGNHGGTHHGNHDHPAFGTDGVGAHVNGRSTPPLQDSFEDQLPPTPIAPAPTRARKRSEAQHAICAAWHQVAAQQQARGEKVPELPAKDDKAAWNMFWKVVAKTEALIVPLGLPLDQIEALLGECYRWKVADWGEWGKGKPFTLTTLNGALPAWWREVKAPQLARLAEIAAHSNGYDQAAAQHLQQVTTHNQAVSRRSRQRQQSPFIPSLTED